MELKKQLMEEAMTWIGTPFVHRGTKKSGCDCTGLLIGIVQACGYIPDYKMRKYPKDWNLHEMASGEMVRNLLQFGALISNKNADAGDILVFHWGKCDSHVGILVKNKMFLHMMGGGKCKLSSLARLAHKKHWTATIRLDEKALKEYKHE